RLIRSRRELSGQSQEPGEQRELTTAEDIDVALAPGGGNDDRPVDPTRESLDVVRHDIVRRLSGLQSVEGGPEAFGLIPVRKLLDRSQRDCLCQVLVRSDVNFLEGPPTLLEK